MELPSWTVGSAEFARKTCGRVFVRFEADVSRVIEIMSTIDAEEVEGYMPTDFVTVWGGVDDCLVYGGKFELRIDLLRVLCWDAGIEILAVTGVRP